MRRNDSMMPWFCPVSAAETIAVCHSDDCTHDEATQAVAVVVVAAKVACVALAAAATLLASHPRPSSCKSSLRVCVRKGRQSVGDRQTREDPGEEKKARLNLHESE